MLRAVIFDFNGVISDDEPLHFLALKTILGEEGIRITQEDYQHHFLGKDDRDCFREAHEFNRRNLSERQLNSLIQRKSDSYLRLVERNLRIFPGVLTFLEQVYSACDLAIASGALRREIDYVLERAGLKHYFCCIVTQEDVSQGKPHPEIFVKALTAINRRKDLPAPVIPEECLVIEDSRAGVDAALAAGMRCLAVANSYTPQELSSAHKVLPSLEIGSDVVNQWIQEW